jgi:hypothetical protein
MDVLLVQVSSLKQQELPEIWVAAEVPGKVPFLEKFAYVLSELPSKGKLFSQNDWQEIKVIKAIGYHLCRDV